MLLGIPWWVFIMIGLIFFCGVMAFRAMQAEKRLEQQFIEKEGKIYMDRMKAEMEAKHDNKQQMHG
ncbi:SigE-dependent sporulation protein [Virgibacillus halodenitrificans]|uniref:Sporulation YhaL family protein n=1 Tax=Virgibacillus halodenitrificans TaxID=1482 RepID=A0ABR7VIF2_VIRHA|nr:sporulation YhaL family protein [Virgibacillus halodenitrificans]MBD1221713.1 sporulation YhaL family protein [Virgibacillus halodenitrificans]MCG1029471.1 sporulation YhaL family protein [Virgibacillus halodenitrificans]MEC2160699.1 sporulation YhaL family protein [Virgibacillus halodenitrificans]MYL46238.1 SigE-dependent sporulation protein [Virgibacillus halodenitrificans]MYL58867.1 SigE-dependent sporulation protein [Virgibacillus halodenitrificans]